MVLLFDNQTVVFQCKQFNALKNNCMLPYPKVNPNIIEIGPIKLRWYGLMYVLGFVSCYFLIGKQRRARKLGLVGAQLQDLIFYLAVGLIV